MQLAACPGLATPEAASTLLLLCPAEDLALLFSPCMHASTGLLRFVSCRCCRFVLGHPLVASAVVGASTLQQLQELLKAAQQGPLQDEQLLTAIDKLHDQYPNPTP